MNHASLFSGIGGFDLAASILGWQNVFHCEIDKFCQQVLQYYWPEAELLTDITKTDFKKYYGTVDVISGGFPCQPFSQAGKRKGTNDSRYLWKQMFRAVCEIKPKYVIAENVYGLLNIEQGLVFESVCTDLESQGYEVQSFIIPAASKNAPHQRQRLFIIGIHSKQVIITNTQCSRSCEKFTKIQSEKPDGKRIECKSCQRNATNTNCNGFNQCNNQYEKSTNQTGINAFNYINKSYGNGDATNTNCIKPGKRKTENSKKQNRFTGNNGKKESITNTNCNGFQGLIQPISNEKRNNKQGKFTTKFTNYDWAVQDKWQSFPTQSGICSRNDGFSNKLDSITFSKWRIESIKAYGNSVCVPVIVELFKILEEYESNKI